MCMENIDGRTWPFRDGGCVAMTQILILASCVYLSMLVSCAVAGNQDIASGYV